MISSDRSSSAPADDDARTSRVDVHHHFTAPAWLDWAEAQGLVRRDKLPWWTRWDLDTALALMDRTGIRTSVMTVAMLGRIQERATREESARVALQAAAKIVADHPSRFAFFTPVFLDDLDLSSWSLRYGLDDLGAVGVSTRTSAGGVYLGDPSHDRLLGELNDRSAVISTHPMDVPGGNADGAGVPGLPPFMCDFLMDTTRAAINLILNGTLDRYPNLTFVLPHGGGFLPYMATRLELFGSHLTPRSNRPGYATTCTASTTTRRDPCPRPRPPPSWPPSIPPGSSSAPTGRRPPPTSSPTSRLRPWTATRPSPVTSSAASTGTTRSG